MNPTDLKLALAIADYLRAQQGPVPWKAVTAAVQEELKLEDWKPVSSMITKLVSKDVVISSRAGKNFMVMEAPHLEEWLEAQLSPPVASETPPVRIAKDRRVDKASWSAYMKAFNAGEIDVLFIPHQATVAAFKLDGQTVKVE